MSNQPQAGQQAGAHLNTNAPASAATRDEFRGVLRPSARMAGDVMARKLFQQRGNHNEIHLSEYELALIVATAVETVLQVKGVKS